MVESSLIARQPQSVIPGLSARLEFFELLRRIERAQDQGPRLGEIGDRSHARLRIVQPADMAFAPREVVSVKQQRDVRKGPSITIVCRHFGLFAPYGPLSIHVTEHARNELIARRNQAFQDFAALLSQRLAILHYRAWAQLHVAVGHDHAAGNHFLTHLRQIAGAVPHSSMSRSIQRLRQSFPGAYLPERGSLRELQRMLTYFFDVPIHIAEHQGRWINDSGNPLQRLSRLGSTRIGQRFFDAQHILSIQIGPLPAPDYALFQRNSERLATLAHICHDFVRYRLVLDISLLIQTEPAMACRLGKAKLGSQGWLKPARAIHRQLVYQNNNQLGASG